MKHNKKQISESEPSKVSKYAKLFNNIKKPEIDDDGVSSETETDINEMGKKVDDVSQFRMVWVSLEKRDIKVINLEPTRFYNNPDKEDRSSYKLVGYDVHGTIAFVIPKMEWEDFVSENSELVDFVDEYFQERGYEIGWAQKDRQRGGYMYTSSPERIQINKILTGEVETHQRDKTDGESPNLSTKLKPPVWKIVMNDFFELDGHNLRTKEINQHLNKLNLPNIVVGSAYTGYNKHTNRHGIKWDDWSNELIPIFSESYTTFDDIKQFRTRLKKNRRGEETEPVKSGHFRYAHNEKNASWSLTKAIESNTKELTPSYNLPGSGYSETQKGMMTYINFELIGKDSGNGVWGWTIKSEIKYGRKRDEGVGNPSDSLKLLKEFTDHTEAQIGEIEQQPEDGGYDLIIRSPGVTSSLIEILANFKTWVMSLTPSIMEDAANEIEHYDLSVNDQNPSEFSLNETKEIVITKKLIESIINKQKGGNLKTP